METPIELIYKETQIHFLIGNSDDVKVNATEMAKAFGKEAKDFLRLDGTKKYIETLVNHLNIGADVPRYKREDIVYSNNKAGTFMHRKLALKFASWLDVEFELWIFDTIDNILFGNYKKHWDEHVKQESARIKMEILRDKLQNNPTAEDAREYFKAEQEHKNAKTAKMRAIKDQYHNHPKLPFID